jgi:hypothetical protein
MNDKTNLFTYDRSIQSSTLSLVALQRYKKEILTPQI